MADNDNSIGPGTVMVAFVVGALTGAAVALLFAPASGEETREYLGQRARETKARAQQALDDGREFYNQQRQGIASAVERGREAFQEARVSRTESRDERGGQPA
jgi:gas vesicle protein